MTDVAAPIPETGSALVLRVNENPSIVLLDAARFDRFYDAVREETSKLVPDLTTAKGRDEIKSMAFKVTKTKTAIDAAGKTLKEEAQKTVQTVDAARRTIRDKLEALAVEVRAPLTEWEVREQVRIEKAEGIIQGLRADSVFGALDTAADIQARLDRVTGAVLDREVLADRFDDASDLHAQAVFTLEAALVRIQREEADRAELARLRAAEEEREAAKAAKQAAYEAAKAAQREAAEKEAARAAAEHAEALRIETAKREAAEEAYRRAKSEDEDRRNAEIAARDEELAVARRRAEEAEAARKRQEAQAEADRQVLEREAEAQRKADEARAADQEHRGRIMGAAKQAVMGHGVGETTARAIVLAIAAGEVPAVSIRF